jgi:hypothetical protein
LVDVVERRKAGDGVAILFHQYPDGTVGWQDAGLPVAEATPAPYSAE